MKYFVWVTAISNDLKKQVFKETFPYEEYENVFAARTSALKFAKDQINSALIDPEKNICIVEVIANLVESSEILIYSQKISDLGNISSQESLSENQITSNLARELEIYKENKLFYDRATPTFKGFIIPID